MAVLCVLPARIASQRIPNKPVQILAGRPLVEWSWRAACEVPGVDAVWVATDDERIADSVRGFGGTVVMTSALHPSGTDRVAEVARSEAGRAFDVIVNFQADEPFLPAAHVAAAIEPVVSGSADIATLATAFRSDEEWNSEAEVKVARAHDGRALYFSRAGIPWTEHGSPDYEGKGWPMAPPPRVVRVLTGRTRAMGGVFRLRTGESGSAWSNCVRWKPDSAFMSRSSAPVRERSRSRMT